MMSILTNLKIKFSKKYFKFRYIGGFEGTYCVVKEEVVIAKTKQEATDKICKKRSLKEYLDIMDVIEIEVIK